MYNVAYLVCILNVSYWCVICAFSALTLLVGWQEGHPACKNWVLGCWCGYQSWARCRLAYGPADALPLTVSCLSKFRLVLPFLYRLTWVVPDKRPLNGCMCVCVLLVWLCDRILHFCMAWALHTSISLLTSGMFFSCCNRHNHKKDNV